MRSAIFAFIGIALVTETGAAEAASNSCNAVILRSLPAIEDSSSVAEPGTVITDVTQFRRDKRSGQTSICSHGGYCYPTHVMVGGKSTPALRIENCSVDFDHPAPSIPGDEEVTYYFRSSRSSEGLAGRSLDATCADFRRSAASKPNDTYRLLAIARAPALNIVSFGQVSGHDLAKNEFETTEEYQARRAARWKHLLGERDVLVIKKTLSPSAVEYDADSGTTTVRLATMDLASAATDKPASAIELDFRVLRRPSRLTGALTRSVSLHFDPSRLAGATGKYSGNEVTLDLDSATARRLDAAATLAMLVAILPDDPTSPVLRIASTRFGERFRGDPKVSKALELSFSATPICAVVLAGTQVIADVTGGLAASALAE
jgi:hypothetical protein